MRTRKDKSGMQDHVHASVSTLRRQLGTDNVDRREFLRTATLLGLSEPVSQAVAAAPKKGGVVQMAMVVQDMSDPHTYDCVEKSNVARQIVEYLTITGADNVTRPMLVESWQASADLKTWTFKVCKGVKFGNGDELIAADVVYNVKRWLDPATGSSSCTLVESWSRAVPKRSSSPPYHHYTEVLLSAVPVADPTVERRRIALEGALPSALDPPKGCPLSTRCPRRIGTICDEEAPPTLTLAAGHRIACHLSVDVLESVEPVADAS